MSFIHLHTHSDYSCLQSLASLKKLVDKCSSYQMPGLALTDLGNLYGMMEFFDYATKASINPLLGCEFYIHERGSKLSEKSFSMPSAHLSVTGSFDYRLNMPEGVYRIILLAETFAGYQELITLSTKSFQQFHRGYPVLSIEDLYSHHQGLIALSGGRGHESYELMYALAKRDHENNEVLSTGSGASGDLDPWKVLTALTQQFYDIFGKDYFYLLLEDHNLPETPAIFKQTIRLSTELCIPLVAGNEICYLEKEDTYSHEIMMCIAGKHQISEKKGFHHGERPYLEGTGYHFKSFAEVEESFKVLPDALALTATINDRCKVNIRDKSFHMPKFLLPAEISGDGYLKKLVFAGLDRIFNVMPQGNPQTASLSVDPPPSSTEDNRIPLHYIDRVENELNVIHSMGFSEYFLIVSDMVSAAKDRGILVGPGRGSVVGSLVAYALGITDLDPMTYDLLFERFLTKGRVSMPDIDIDIQDDRRDEVIDYLRQTYGEKNTCLIITYAKLRARAVFKDVARVFNVDFETANKLSELISNRAVQNDDSEGTTGVAQRTLLRLVYENVAEFKQQIHSHDKLIKVYQHSLVLENLTRQTGIHAAGVVIADRELSAYIPLMRTEKDRELITVSQYDGTVLEKNCGLLKMDVLGLRTLNLIKDAVEQIALDTHFQLAWNDPPLSDKPSFRLFSKGMTMGIFQFESEGMTRYLRELRPDNIDELITMNAIYRPGPMAWIPVYIAKKHNKQPTFQTPEDRTRYERLEKLCERFDLLKEVLGSTRYLPVFQEQIMQICRVFAGFSLEEADEIRAAMGKKKKDLIAKLREKFIAGALRLEREKKDAEFLYDEIIEAFGGYGFNKSHAAAYALLAYRVAYIKANYTGFFMAAFLNSESSSLSEAKMRRIFQECERMNVSLYPPSINASMARFQYQKKELLFSFHAIKGVSGHVARAIVAERSQHGSFKNLTHFLRRMNRYEEENAGGDRRFVFSKQVGEALVKAQCFDELYGETSWQKENLPEPLRECRADILFAMLPHISKVLDTERALYSGGQQNLFALRPQQSSDMDNSTPHNDDYAIELQALRGLASKETDRVLCRELEKKILGFNFREDITLKYAKTFARLTNFEVDAPQLWEDGDKFILAGILHSMKERVTRQKQEEMCIFEIHTGLKILEVVCFPSTWKRIKAAATRLDDQISSARAEHCTSALVLDNPIKVTGTFRRNSTRRDRLSLIVQDIAPIKTDREDVENNASLQKITTQKMSGLRQGQGAAEDAIPPAYEKNILITLNGAVQPQTLEAIRQALSTQAKGASALLLSFQASDQWTRVTLGDDCKIQPTEAALQLLRKISRVADVSLIEQRSPTKTRTRHVGF